MKQNKSPLQIDKTPIKQKKLYTLHKATLGKDELFARVYQQDIISKFGVDETLDFNIEIFGESKGFLYADNFVHIEESFYEGNYAVWLVNKHEEQLDQFIKNKGPQNQRQALEIFQEILKVVYSLVMAGFWHRNLRAEHFVKLGRKWKLWSVVLSEMPLKQGLNTQYTYNTQYQPPQAYQKPNFTDEELDQRIVWDLGNILIHLLLGNHKLKNLEILNKFKGEPFSFKKLGASIQEKFSPKLKEILGRMCHYNQKERMTFNQLIQSGYFSRQLAEHNAKNKGTQNKKMYTGSSISVSQSMKQKKSEDGLKILNGNEIGQNIRKSQRDEENILSSMKNTTQIESNQKFKSNLEILMEHENNINMPSLEQINNNQTNQIINLYKNYIDKGRILGSGAQKFEQMSILFDDKRISRQLIDLTTFAVNFVKCMDLCQLAKAMNENKTFFKVEREKWMSFHGSPEYYALKKLINFWRREELEFLENLRAKLIQSNNSFMLAKQRIANFVQNCWPERSTFVDIKQAYRTILKLSYDMIADYYTENKTWQWARLGMYITYCLAIDKMYIQSKLQSNFQYFFRWSKQLPNNYISLQKFQQYLDNAPKQDLIQNSRYIIKEFYEI